MKTFFIFIKMKIFYKLVYIFILLLIIGCKPASSYKPQSDFMLGNEVLLSERTGEITGKRIGLVSNQSGIDTKGVHILDNLINGGYNVVKVFTPEHGFRGDDNVDSYKDTKTGVQIISLYGNKKKPDASDLKDVDVLIYDLQDVGARFYTYINTLFYLMQSANENNIKVIVCDRPIMSKGDYADGFMLDEENRSFVGMLDIPIAYGMTSGEIAKYINSEYFGNGVQLSISEMKGYDRKKEFSSYNIPWVKPSPSIYFPSSALCYTGTCLLEGTNVSEGRGTEKPFEIIGAPFVNGEKLSEEMNSLNLSGVSFEPVKFIPTEMPNAIPVKFVGENCEGVYIKVTDYNRFEPVKTGIGIIVSLKKLFAQFEFRKDNFIAKLSGTKKFRKMIESGAGTDEIIKSYLPTLEDFKVKRASFLLY